MKTPPDLAQVKRRGWLQRGVPEADCESVAEHSHAVATYCLVSAPIEWRTEAAEVALVHDLAEVVTGDIIPADGINAEQKRSREELAFEYLESVNPSITGLKAFLDDCRNNVTPAARFVHDVDKLQRLIRAAKYAQKYPHLDFGDFKEDVTAIENADVRREATDVVESWNSRKSLTRHSYVLVLGGPGVGKGTQSALAAEKLDALHVSAGQLLRDEQARENSPFGSFISKSFQQNAPVPARLIIDLMQEVVGKYSGTVVILDGFPLTREQLDCFEEEIVTSYTAIHLKASKETLLARLQARATSSQRTDDSLNSRSQRVQAFMSRESEVLKLMRARERNIVCLDGEGEIEEVHSRIMSALCKT